jgi:hypothetical protein
LEQGRTADAAKIAREAAPAFRVVQASAAEAEAALIEAAAQIEQNVGQARTLLERASQLLRDSLDARLSFRRQVLLARLRLAEGRHADSLAVLERSLDQARRTGLLGAELEARLAIAQAGRTAAVGPLSVDARRAGFLLIAKKAQQ